MKGPRNSKTRAVTAQEISAVRRRVKLWKELALEEETDPMSAMIKDIETLLLAISQKRPLA